MKHLVVILALLFPVAAFSQMTNKADSVWMLRNYTKKEVYIPMRDGKRLFTAIYEPKAAGKHPILEYTLYGLLPEGVHYGVPGCARQDDERG